MSEILEQQTEEREALQSIYEGDEAFKEVNSTTFQYKVIANNYKNDRKYLYNLFYYSMAKKIITNPFW